MGAGPEWNKVEGLDWGKFEVWTLIWLLGAIAWLAARLRHLLVTRLIAACCFVTGYWAYSNYCYSSPHPDDHIADLAVGVIAAGLLVVSADCDIAIQAAGTAVNRFLQFLSDYSYSLFLAHLPVVFLILSYVPPSWWRMNDYSGTHLARFLFIYAASNAAGVALYFLCERHYHFIRAKVSAALLLSPPSKDQRARSGARDQRVIVSHGSNSYCFPRFQ
jgi:peptidoglycan/LPS O-acetylase OafA/YrhL